MPAEELSQKPRASRPDRRTEYRIEVWEEPDGTYRGHFPDLPRSEFTARSEAAALGAARAAFDVWKKRAEELGAPLPPPNSRSKFSGIVRIRVGRSVHRRLLDKCTSHDVALSNLVSSILHAGLDWLEGDMAAPALAGDMACAEVPTVAIVKKREIDYSQTKATGSWTQNIPVELHQRLHMMARAEGVSINLLCNFLITRVLFDFRPVEQTTKTLRLAVA